MRRHFGDMLLERRRQLGASIQQVSNVVKIRPQIIEYFETENFAAMPPRGYAQGMISSYARYLGLNPRDVVDAYFDALHEYEHGSGGRVGRFQEAAADASPRSSNAPARYMMVNSIPSSRYGVRPQQAGYVSESTSPHEPMSSARLRPAQPGRAGAPRGYDPSLRSRANGRQAPYDPARRGGARPAARDGRAQGRDAVRDSRGSHGVPARQRREGAYERGYREPAGARRGGDYRGGRRPPHGRGGSSQSSMSPLDPRLLIAGVVALLVLVLLIVFAMRGCAPKPTEKPGSSGVSVSQVDKDKGSNDSTDDSEDGGEDSSDAASQDDSPDDAQSGKPAKDEPKETIVKVSVKEKGAVAWVEVKLDGKIVLGKQVLGPFEQEFTVTSQIDITTDSPSDVTVRKNGEKVRYDTKVSGVGKVSIVVPKPEKSDEKVVDSDGDGTPDMTAEEAEKAGIPVPASDAVDGSSPDAA